MDAVVAVHQFEVGAERPHRLQLLLGERVRTDEADRVPLDRAHERQGTPGRTTRVLDDRLARPEITALLCSLDHRQCHPVLVGAGRVSGFELDPDLAGVGPRKAGQADDGGLADPLERPWSMRHRSPSSSMVRRQQ